MSTRLHHPLSQDCGSGERSNTQINHCLVARVFPELLPVLRADVHSSLHLTVQPGVSGGPRDHHRYGDHQHGGRRLQQPCTVCQSQQRLVRRRVSPLLCLFAVRRAGDTLIWFFYSAVGWYVSTVTTGGASSSWNQLKSPTGWSSALCKLLVHCSQSDRLVLCTLFFLPVGFGLVFTDCHKQRCAKTSHC